MTKQRPDPDKIANELAGGSSFFRKPTPLPEPSIVDQVPGSPVPAEPTSPVIQHESRTPVRPVRAVKRQMIRHAFELYLDQLERLREMAEDQRRQGEPGSMSRMVRDAIDRYLESADSSH